MISLPHSPAVEAAALGAALCNEVAMKRCADRLTSDSFYQTKNQVVFSAMVALLSDGKVADPVTVYDQIGAVKMEEIGGKSVIGHIVAESGAPENIEDYIDILINNQKRRRMVAISGEMSKIVNSKSATQEDLTSALDEMGALNDMRDGRRSVIKFFNFDFTHPPVIPWLVKPYFAVGDVVVAAAQFATKKTWLFFDLSIAVCIDRKWLNCKVETPGKVLYIDGELPPHVVQLRVAKLYKQEKPENLSYWHMPGLQLEKPASINMLESAIIQSEPRLVVIDSLSNFHGVNEKNAEDLNPILQNIIRLARKYSCTIIIVHHFGKDDGKKTPAQLLRGSSVLGDRPDQVFAMKSVGAQGVKLEHIKARHSKPAATLIFEVTDIDEERTRIVVTESGLESDLDVQCSQMLAWIKHQEAKGESPLRSEIKHEFCKKRKWGATKLGDTLAALISNGVCAKTQQTQEGVKYFTIQAPPEVEVEETGKEDPAEAARQVFCEVSEEVGTETDGPESAGTVEEDERGDA